MLYGVAAVLVYGVEHTSWAPVVALLSTFVVLIILGILLYLRHYYGGLLAPALILLFPVSLSFCLVSSGAIPAHTKPVFVLQPVSVKGGIGSLLTFTAVAESIPAPTYQVHACTGFICMLSCVCPTRCSFRVCGFLNEWCDWLLVL